MLIHITDTDLRDKAQDGFDDVYFTKSDGVTKLAHEIEYNNSATGGLVAWVIIPYLSGST